MRSRPNLFGPRCSALSAVVAITGLLLASLSLSQARADGEPLPLSLTLDSSRDLCTANTLTEVSWQITGGNAPFSLSVEGQPVTARGGNGRLTVNCGSLPSAGEPQIRKITAEVTDARGRRASASVRLSLAAALSSPIIAGGYGVHRTFVLTEWTRGIGRTDTAAQAPSYLARWRATGSDTWNYELWPRAIEPGDRRENYQRGVAIFDLTPGVAYEMAVAALRAKIERDTPQALTWSSTLSFTTLQAPQNVRAETTHNTLTVSWDAQPDGDSYSVRVQGPHGSRSQNLYPAKGMRGQHSLVFRALPAGTSYEVAVITNAGYDSATTTIQTSTAPAPPAGASVLPRGPQNLRVTATSDTISVSWDPPHPQAEPSYIVYLYYLDRIVQDQWVEEGAPTRVTFAGLQSGATYQLEIVHLGIIEESRERKVRTGSQNRHRGNAEVPIPFWW